MASDHAGHERRRALGALLMMLAMGVGWLSTYLVVS